MLSPDRNPDGFDGHRRRYIADGLADLATQAMPPAQAREFRLFLQSMSNRGGKAVPRSPKGPPKVRAVRYGGGRRQGKLL